MDGCTPARFAHVAMARPGARQGTGDAGRGAVRVSGPGLQPRTSECHHERCDEEHDAERDARVATLRMLGDHVSRVPGEERRKRVRRLRHVQNTSRDGSDSEDEQDYHQNTLHW